MKFQKRPVIVEAIQFTGANHADVIAFCPPAGYETMRGGAITIPTLEGKMLAAPGDWIIREPFPTSDRQFYPCKPDIFEATYERVDDGNSGWARQIEKIEAIIGIEADHFEQRAIDELRAELGALAASLDGRAAMREIGRRREGKATSQ